MLRLVKSSIISVRLSSPYFSLISKSSSFIIDILFDSLSKIPLSSAMCCIISLYSLIILSVSSPVNRCSLMSKIACDCISDNPKPSIKDCLAVIGSLLFLIVSTILSMFFKAILRPSKICALASAFFRSNSVLFTTTSSLKDINTSKSSFKDITFGVPSTKASKIIPKVS